MHISNSHPMIFVGSENDITIIEPNIPLFQPHFDQHSIQRVSYCSMITLKNKHVNNSLLTLIVIGYSVHAASPRNYCI